MCLYQVVEENPEHHYLKKTELVPFLEMEIEESINQIGLGKATENQREETNHTLTLVVTNTTTQPITTTKSGNQNTKTNTTIIVPTDQVDGATGGSNEGIRNNEVPYVPTIMDTGERTTGTRPKDKTQSTEIRTETKLILLAHKQQRQI